MDEELMSLAVGLLILPFVLLKIFKNKLKIQGDKDV